MIMKICFGENLKHLRKEKALTQEALAEHLGVSFQTISKWERGETYPDIMLLPVISAFFDVSVDDLLGTDKVKKQQKVKAYTELFEKMQLCEVSSVLEKYENAVKEFPNEYPILINYMELLHIEKGRVSVKDYKPLSDKLVSVYEKIQKHCTDDGIRIRSKRIMLEHLMWQYECLGWLDTGGQKLDEKYKKQAEEIFNTLPCVSDSREYLSVFISSDSDERRENIRSAIEELSYLLQNVIISYCYYDSEYTPQYKAEVIKHMNAIMKIVDSDECLTKNRMHIIYNYGHLGHLYAQIGDSEAALYYFELAADEALKFDRLPDSDRTSIYYEREMRFRNMSMRERLCELMTEHYPISDELRKTPEFQAIITKLHNSN